MNFNNNFNLNIPNKSYHNSNSNQTSLETSTINRDNMDSSQNITFSDLKTENPIELDTTNQLDESMVDNLQLKQEPLPLQINNSSNTNSLLPQNIRPLTINSANSTVPSFQSNKPPSNEFVRKLFSILEKNAYPEIVRWADNGDSFVVIDTGKFTSHILPNHFKHSNFASFVRQLNKYDFHKVKRKQDEKPKYGDLSWEFKHPSFRIHYEAGLDNIKRKITVSKKDADFANLNGSNTANSNINNGNVTNQLLNTKTKESLMQNMVSKDSFNNLKSKVTRLENELKASKEEVGNIKIESDRMNTKYTTLLESLITFKTVHESLASNFNSVCSILVNRGIDIPQNLFNNIPTQKLPQYNLQNENGLNNALSDTSSASPIQNMHQQALMNSLDGQIPMINTPNNNLLIPQPPNIKSHLQSPDNNTNSPSGSAAITSIHSNNSNNINAGTNISANNANINNENTNMNEADTNNDNNIPTDLSEVPLRKGFHVLLVEDDAISIQLCSRFLRKYGCTVEVVTDGLSAISTLEKFRYDLVLMDIVMPNLDGATATSIVRSFDNHTPIIAMTGNIEDQDLLTYLQHGMNDILAKPFTRNDLHSMLVRYLKDRVPLCEQKESLGRSNNSQLSPNMIQTTPHITTGSPGKQNTSISPTLSTPRLQQSQQIHPPLQQPASIDSNPSQIINQTQSQLVSQNSSTFDGNEPASKKQRI